MCRYSSYILASSVICISAQPCREALSEDWPWLANRACSMVPRRFAILQNCMTRLCLGCLFRIQQCVKQTHPQRMGFQWSTASSNPAQRSVQTPEEVPLLRVRVFLFIPFCIYTFSCIINASTVVFFNLACDFCFSHCISFTLACASLFLIFLFTVNHPPSPLLSPFSLDRSPTSLQYRQISPICLSSLVLPPSLPPFLSLSLSSSLPFSLPLSFPPSSV